MISRFLDWLDHRIGHRLPGAVAHDAGEHVGRGADLGTELSGNADEEKAKSEIASEAPLPRNDGHGHFSPSG